MAGNHKVPLRGTFCVLFYDQAANLFEVLTWSFPLKSVLRTANNFDVLPDNNLFHVFLGDNVALLMQCL